MKNAVTPPLAWLLVCAVFAYWPPAVGAAEDGAADSRPALSTLDYDFSPDGRLLAAATGGGVVVWETGSWNVAFTHRAESGCSAVKFSADGNRLAFCDSGPAAGVIDVASGTLLNRWEADTTRLYLRGLFG